MNKRKFRGTRIEAARYPTREESSLLRRRVLAGLGAIVGAAGLAACDPLVTQGEPVMPDVDAGELQDAGLGDAGEPDAQVLAGEPALPDGGEK